MHAISSYRGNRPTHTPTHKHTPSHKQTGPITIHCTTASAQCNEDILVLTYGGCREKQTIKRVTVVVCCASLSNNCCILTTINETHQHNETQRENGSVSDVHHTQHNRHRLLTLPILSILRKPTYFFQRLLRVKPGPQKVCQRELLVQYLLQPGCPSCLQPISMG